MPAAKSMSSTTATTALPSPAQPVSTTQTPTPGIKAADLLTSTTVQSAPTNAGSTLSIMQSPAPASGSTVAPTSPAASFVKDGISFGVDQVGNLVPGYGIPGGIKDTVTYGSQAIQDFKSGKPIQALGAGAVATLSAGEVVVNVAGSATAIISSGGAAAPAIGAGVALGAVAQSQPVSNVEQSVANAVVNSR